MSPWLPINSLQNINFKNYHIIMLYLFAMQFSPSDKPLLMRFSLWVFFHQLDSECRKPSFVLFYFSFNIFFLKHYFTMRREIWAPTQPNKLFPLLKMKYKRNNYFELYSCFNLLCKLFRFLFQHTNLVSFYKDQCVAV